mgnify:CR=1 FL=1
MDFNAINWLAVIVAAASAFLLGGLWYSPALFGKAWLQASGLTEEDAQSGHPGKVYGLSFLLALLGSAALALLLGPAPVLLHAVGVGFVAGFALVAGSFGINYLFERKSGKLLLINGGYHTVQYTIVGIILGLWH